MRHRLPLALSLAALVVAVFGSTPVGHAVGELVGTPQLRDRSVTSPKLASNAVTSAKVADGSIKGPDLRAASITGDHVADGSLQAADLAAGAIPPAEKVTIRRAHRDVSGAGLFELQVACAAGDRLVGGGGGFTSRTSWSFVGNDFSGSLINNAPAMGTAAVDDQGAPTNWYVQARNAGGNKRLVAYAICST